jgi:hypothetical protein
MPPVEVPAMRSKRFAILSFVLSSISLRFVAGMIPRIPPPSIERTFFVAPSFRSDVEPDSAAEAGRLPSHATPHHAGRQEQGRVPCSPALLRAAAQALGTANSTQSGK